MTKMTNRAPRRTNPTGVMEQTSSHPYFMMRYMGARRLLPDQE